MATQGFAPKGEIGHHGKHQIVIAMLGEGLRCKGKIAVHAMRASHVIHADTEGYPVGKGIMRLDANVIAAQRRLRFVDAPQIGAVG